MKLSYNLSIFVEFHDTIESIIHQQHNLVNIVEFHEIATLSLSIIIVEFHEWIGEQL